MEEQLDHYVDKCRCCLEEITLAKVEIDTIVDMKFFEMTQLNLAASNLLPSFICYDCYEILTNYSAFRMKFIENQQKLEQMLLNAENVITEDDNNVFEYEEIEMTAEESDQLIVEENQHLENIEIIEEDPPEEEEEEDLKLEDIIKPEFLHYCLPKKEPEPAKKVFHVPRQLERKSHKIEQKILQENTNQDLDFACQECGRNFANSLSFQQHVKQDHQKYVCEFEECSKIFNSQFQLNKHIAAFHKKSLHECQHCDKKFIQKLHLRNHLYVHNK